MADALHTPGGVQAVEARLDDAGLLAVQGPTAIDARTGVLLGPGATALVTGTSSTGPMTVAIAPHHWVTTRGSSSGPYRGTLEAATTVTIAAAPAAGNSRIDVVYVKQQSTESGIPSPDATIAPLYGVLQGTAATTGTQAKPSLSTIVGAEELATVQVAAGATATNGSGVTITNTARITTTRGGLVVNRTQAEADQQTAYPGLQQLMLDSRRRRWHDGTQWRYNGDGLITRVLAAAQTLATTTDGKLTCFATAAQSDPAAMWDGTNKQLNIPYTGNWRVYAQLPLGGTLNTTTWIFGRVVKSSTQSTPPTNVIGQEGHITAEAYLTFEYDGPLAAGDVLTFQYWTNGTPTIIASSFGAPGFLIAEYKGS